MLPVQLLEGPIAGIPDLDQIRRWLERIQEMLALGGVALATAASLLFILAWVLSHARRPMTQSKPTLALVALLSSYVPVALTLVAAVGVFVPLLKPLILQAFALAVVIAATVWCISVAAILIGGSRRDLSRARRALLLAGTPWYCLALYLSTYL